MSLLDYGAFFGKREVFGENGYTERTKPNRSSMNTTAAPSTRLADRSAHNVFSTSSPSAGARDPTANRRPRRSSTPKHDGCDIAYRGRWNYDAGRHRHTLQLTLDSKRVDNRENIYTVQNEEVGLSYIRYLGQTEVGSKVRQSASLLYTGQFGAAGHPYVAGPVRRRSRPSEEFRHKLSRLSESGADGGTSGRTASATSSGAGISSPPGWGSVTPQVRAIPVRREGFEEAGTSETLTRTLDELLLQEYEYLTARRLDLSVDLGMSRRFGNRGIRGFAALEYTWSKAFGMEYLGRAMRHAALLRIGCRF